MVCSLCFSPLMGAENSVGESYAFDPSAGKIQTASDTTIRSAGQVAKGVMVGIAVFGATVGIGSLVSKTAESIGRQPEVSDKLIKAMNSGILACASLAVGAMAISFFF